MELTTELFDQIVTALGAADQAGAAARDADNRRAARLNLAAQVTNVNIMDFRPEIDEIARDRSAPLWMMLPGPLEGSSFPETQGSVLSTPARMKELGWTLVETQRFSGVLLYHLKAD